MKRILLLALAATQPGVTELPAQGQPGPLAGPAMGVSMDRFMAGDASLIAMSYRFSALRPGGFAPELGVALFPQALPAGILALAPDLGASYNITIPGGTLLLKAGGSAAVVLGVAGAYFLPGLHMGGTLLIKTDNRSAVRLDVVKHFYRPGEGEISPLWSVGLGFAILPRNRM
jgi:hypothetical protein